MAQKTYIFIFFVLLGLSKGWSQNDSINWLEEVVLSDVKLLKNTKGQHIQKLSDSTLRKHEPLLTNVLKFNTPIYFRENGYGMVSSASLRGTGASQTAVIWNGININSQFTGQTDFNTINTGGYDNLKIKPGGGSVIYGSGAIGGTIHLNNALRFTGENSHYLQLSYGSFNTSQIQYNGKFSNKKTSVGLNISGINSENDYEYLDTDLKNENGDFYNYSINASIGHWVNESNIVKLYTSFYRGDRGFSGTLVFPSNSKYEDINSKNLLEWKSFFSAFTSSLKVAYLKERYNYFENRDSENFSFGEAETGILKYDLQYNLDKNKSLNLIADYTNVNGEGSDINHAERKTTGVSLLWQQTLGELNYQASLRQEFNAAYNSPLLFSLGGNYQVTDFYQLKLNASRNFRIPTFNDLYWAAGGNPDLDPETSLQAELGNQFNFKQFELTLNTFFINTDNLLRWVPGNDGVFRPENTNKVHNYGIEVFADWAPNLKQNPLHLKSTYAFTKSINQENNKQLIYVPMHKVTFSVSYDIKDFEIFMQQLYNGSIYTSSDNAYSLEGYHLTNLGGSYRLDTKPALEIAFQINNLLNTKYQSMPSRIMPGRSFKTSLIFKF